MANFTTGRLLLPDKIYVMVYLFWLSGAICLFLAFFAYALGIDHTPDWGTSRWFLLGVGILFLSAGVFRHWQTAITRCWQASRLVRWFHRQSERLHGSCLIQFLGNTRFVRFLTTPGLSNARWMAAIIVTLGCLTACWLVTAGTMTDFSRTTLYYDRLADSFLHGRLSLLETPDPRLAELSNPYDYRQRGDIPIVWDASYFQDQYYLYWGPVPAILVCVLKGPFHIPIGDMQLTLFFTIGIMAVQTILITEAYRRWFDHLPAGLVVAPLLASTFSVPLLWQLSRPSIYESAIAGGQFFWLLGLAFCFKGFDNRDHQSALFFASGLAWAAAIGSRANLAVPIGAGFAVLLVIFITRHKVRKACLFGGLAFALGMTALGWYNFARFGSLFETGYSYQLTGPAAVSVVNGELFSPTYVLPNFFNMFLRPVIFDSEFPFVHSPWLTEAMWPFFIKLPSAYYYSEPISGLLITCPFMVFLAGVFVKRLLCKREISILLASAGLSILASLAFITSFMRYLLDFSPALLLLAVAGFWQAAEKSSGWRTVGLLLALWGAALGLLLSLAGPNNNFLNNNPALFQWLAELFA